MWPRSNGHGCIPGGLARLIHRFAGACFGGIGVSFALSLPALLVVMGAASDYAIMTKLRAELQEAADAAAMAGAREIPLANADHKQIENAARLFAIYRLTGDAGATAEALEAAHITVDAKVADDFSAVDVTIKETWSPFFAHLVSSKVTPIQVTAAARFVGRTNICVLGTATSGTAVLLDKNSRLTGNNCGVFSNSTGSAGLRINTGAVVKATMICSAGGVDKNGATADPMPLTDCPAVGDPLASRPPPGFGGCDYTSLVLTDESRTIDPGVYCGGLKIGGSSSVKLNPGVYIIKNGPLHVSGSASLEGDGVGFYITGSAGATNFGSNTRIALSAPTSGPMAGLLIFEDRALVSSLKHRISSDDARKLIGTIYLPVGDLIIDAKEPVADQSAYTAIITHGLELNSGPNLVLNSDYDATDVPVPAGIAGSSQVILSN